jgi:hypothetical protein
MIKAGIPARVHDQCSRWCILQRMVAASTGTAPRLKVCSRDVKANSGYHSSITHHLGRCSLNGIVCVGNRKIWHFRCSKTHSAEMN